MCKICTSDILYLDLCHFNLKDVMLIMFFKVPNSFAWLEPVCVGVIQ